MTSLNGDWIVLAGARSGAGGVLVVRGCIKMATPVLLREEGLLPLPAQRLTKIVVDYFLFGAAVFWFFGQWFFLLARV